MAIGKYCILKAMQHAFNKKFDLSIDFGSEDIPADYTEFMKNCESEVDALNFMSAKGWELVVSNANQSLYETRHLMIKRG
jgi:hypothetical protein